MIWLPVALAAFAVVVLAGLVILASQSHRPPPLGLVAGRLRPRTGLPNCVCSEPPGNIEPIPLTDSAWDQARQAILAAGGRIITETPGYLHATFTTRVFRFVDDLELRRDAPAGVIHVRAAARVGQRDFGVNRRRAEALRREEMLR